MKNIFLRAFTLAAFTAAFVFKAQAALNFHSFDAICPPDTPKPNPYDNPSLTQGLIEQKTIKPWKESCKEYGYDYCQPHPDVSTSGKGGNNCYMTNGYGMQCTQWGLWFDDILLDGPQACPDFNDNGTLSQGVQGNDSQGQTLCVSQSVFNDYISNSSPCDADNDGKKDCPQGYIDVVIESGGKKGCYEVECPPQGTSSDRVMVSASKLQSGEGGIACDRGMCAYDVAGGQVGELASGQVGVVGISRGQICGQGPNDKSFTPDSDKSECDVFINAAGNEQLKCDKGEEEPPEESQVDTDSTTDNDLNEDDSEMPDPDPCQVADDCGSGDIIKAIKDSSAKNSMKIEEAANAQIKTQEDLTGKLLLALKELDKSIVSGNEKINRAIVNTGGNSQIVGGSTGDSSGSGDSIDVDMSGVESQLQNVNDKLDITNAHLDDLTNTDVPATTQASLEAQFGLTSELEERTIVLDDYSAEFDNFITAEGCPASRSYNFTVRGTSYGIDFNYQPICDISEFIGSLMIITATLASGFMVQRAMS